MDKQNFEQTRKKIRDFMDILKQNFHVDEIEAFGDTLHNANIAGTFDGPMGGATYDERAKLTRQTALLKQLLEEA